MSESARLARSSCPKALPRYDTSSEYGVGSRERRTELGAGPLGRASRFPSGASLVWTRLVAAAMAGLAFHSPSDATGR